MKIYIGDKLHEFSEEQLEYMYLDEGNEGIVYRYKEKAIKIYKDYCFKERLDEKTAILMSKIKTRRILLPETMVYSINHEFRGYTTKFIQAYLLSHINEMTMRNFLAEVEIYDDDINILSKEKILLNDFLRENLKYDSKLYMVDPGSFYKCEEEDSTTIEKANAKELNNLVVCQIFYAVPGLTKGKKIKLLNHFEDIDQISSVLKEEAKPEEKVKEYVKRICA